MSWCIVGISVQTHSVVPFPCFHLGKSLLNLWTPLSQSFPGSETLVTTSSNHCCLITQASKRHYHYKLLPMCCVSVFNTSQGCTLRVYSPFIWKDNFSKIFWPVMDFPSLLHPHPALLWPILSVFRSFYS